VKQVDGQLQKKIEKKESASFVGKERLKQSGVASWIVRFMRIFIISLKEF